MDDKKNNSDPKPNETLPNTAAYQDSFTREFMVSPEEVEEEFYLFKSGTSGFTMLFPVDAKMNDEEIEIHGNNPEFKTQYLIRLRYFNEESTNWVDSYLKLTSSYNGYDGEYGQYSINDNTIYYAESKDIYPEYKNGTVFRFFGYYKANKSNQAIIYS